MARSTRPAASIIAVTFWKGVGAILSVASAVGMANIFGATASTDAYFLARRLITNVGAVMERSAHLLFVPQFVRIARHAGIDAIRDRVRGGERNALAVSIAVCAALIIFAEPIVSVLAPGFGAQTRADAGTLAMGIVFAVGVRRVFRQARDAGPMYGEVAQARGGESPEAPLPGSSMRVLAMVLAQIHVVAASTIDLAFASTTGEGGLAALEYGQRLVGMAPGVVSTSAAMVYYTEFAVALSAGDHQTFRRLLADSLRRSLLLVAPIAAGIFVMRDMIVDILFAHGSFSPQAAAATTGVVAVLAPLLLINTTLGALFGALMADDRVPRVRIIAVSAACAISARVAFDWFTIDRLGLVAVPLGALLGMSTMLVVMYGWMRLRALPTTSFPRAWC